MQKANASNLSIWLNGRLVLPLEDLANPNNGLNSKPDIVPAHLKKNSF